jgi:hypothetical protein
VIERLAVVFVLLIAHSLSTWQGGWTHLHGAAVCELQKETIRASFMVQLQRFREGGNYGLTPDLAAHA